MIDTLISPAGQTGEKYDSIMRLIAGLGIGIAVSVWNNAHSRSDRCE